MSFENLVLEEKNGWLEVTVDRPKVLNALNRATMRELDRMVDELETREVRGLILTGSGEKAFVAGADITELSGLAPDEAMAYASRGQAVFSRIERATKPIIAAVNGFALGGGCELALACHIRVFSTKARVGLPEVSLGVIPGYGGTQRLSRVVGMGRAIEIVLTGDMIDAAEAYRIGLANHLAEPEELMDTCRKLAASIDRRGPRAVSYALCSIVRGREMALEEALAFEVGQFGLAANTEDWKEGTQAFLEKREAKFRGR